MCTAGMPRRGPARGEGGGHGAWGPGGPGLPLDRKSESTPDFRGGDLPPTFGSLASRAPSLRAFIPPPCFPSTGSTGRRGWRRLTFARGSGKAAWRGRVRAGGTRRWGGPGSFQKVGSPPCTSSRPQPASIPLKVRAPPQSRQTRGAPCWRRLEDLGGPPTPGGRRACAFLLPPASCPVSLVSQRVSIS